MATNPEEPNMSSSRQVKVWVRWSTSAEAVASAGRLVRKYGPQFAVVLDEMGIPGFISPFAVVSHPTVTSAR